MEWMWSTACVFGGTVGLCLLVLRIYLRWGVRYCHSKVDLTGRTVLVTGANTGTGYWTALRLAKCNARVVLGCRHMRKGQNAAKRIIAETNNANVVVRKLDLSLMKSVREFAEQFLAEETRLDILLNNAGIAGIGKKTMTEEGFELCYATNHFGPFLLTNLLLDLIKKSSPSRIVNVSSVGHRWCKCIDFNNLKAENSYDPGMVYLSSKLANILFTVELASRLRHTGVTVNSVHPGCVSTELYRSMPFGISILFAVLKLVCFKTAEEGAQTLLHCALSEELEGVTGKYFVDFKETEAAEAAKDEGMAKKLWEISEIYTGSSS